MACIKLVGRVFAAGSCEAVAVDVATEVVAEVAAGAAGGGAPCMLAM